MSNDGASSGSPLNALLSLFSLSQLTALLDLFSYLRSKWRNETDPYEFLECESTLELLDPQGATALFSKRQKVKFLQNHIIAFEDYAWGDGDVMVEYRCSPGVVVDRYQEGDRWNILVSLRETKNKGDIEEFTIERMEVDTFTKDEEWQQIEIRRRTHQLQVNIIFPKERLCQRATLTQRTQSRVTVFGPEHFHRLPDGRQRLTWETKNARAYDIYTIRWRW